MKTETPTPILTHKQRHFAALESLRSRPLYTGASIYHTLRTAERQLNRLAERMCNEKVPENLWDENCEKARGLIRHLFGHLPAGLHFNSDPRGYALKLDTDAGAVLPDGLHRDFGGYGILAPEF